MNQRIIKNERSSCGRMRKMKEEDKDEDEDEDEDDHENEDEAVSLLSPDHPIYDPI